MSGREDSIPVFRLPLMCHFVLILFAFPRPPRDELASAQLEPEPLLVSDRAQLAVFEPVDRFGPHV